MPSMDDILRMRKDINKAYSEVFCPHFLKPVVTDKQWKAKSHMVELSGEDFVTNSDESFALLILENNWDYWTAIAMAKDKQDTTITTPVYTCDAKKAGVHNGWSIEGKQRFNKLMDNVKADRAADHRRAFEEAFKTAMAEKFSKNRKKRGRKDGGETTRIVITIQDDL